MSELSDTVAPTFDTAIKRLSEAPGLLGQPWTAGASQDVTQNQFESLLAVTDKAAGQVSYGDPKTNPRSQGGPGKGRVLIDVVNPTGMPQSANGVVVYEQNHHQNAFVVVKGEVVWSGISYKSAEDGAESALRQTNQYGV